MNKPKTAAEAMDMIFKRKIKKGTLKPDSTVSVQFTSAKKDCGCGSTSSPTAKKSSKKTQLTTTKKDCNCGSVKLTDTIKHEQ